MATKRTTATNKNVVTPEARTETLFEEKKPTETKKDVFVIRNVICKYGSFESGKTYSVTLETEKKLKGLGAIRC